MGNTEILENWTFASELWGWGGIFNEALHLLVQKHTFMKFRYRLNKLRDNNYGIKNKTVWSLKNQIE